MAVTKEIQQVLNIINAKEPDKAIKLLHKILAKNFRHADALSVLGQLYVSLEKFELAIEPLENFLKLAPNDTLVFPKLAYAYEKNQNYQKAIHYYNLAVQADPQNLELLECLGRVLAKDNETYAALINLQKAIDLGHSNLAVHNNLALMAKDLGAYEISLFNYKKALEFEPDNFIFFNSIIFNLHKDPRVSLAEILTWTQKFHDKILSKIESKIPQDQVRSRLDSAKKKIRLAFLSADFNRHPAGTIFLPILERLDRNSFDIFLYYASDKQDNMTDNFKNQAPLINVNDLDDYQVANLIFENKIDVLIDLSGFTLGGRPAVLKMKPAPLQISYLGYFGTQAIPEIDFLIADEHCVKEGEEKYYTERIYKIPHIGCHGNLDVLDRQDLSPPVLKNSFITFGSTNNFHKINYQVLQLWAKILHAVPGSKLLIETLLIRKQSNLYFITETLKNLGINQDRLILRSSLHRNDFLGSYLDIDISLSPFPYGGSTTTIESMIMSVPVVTLEQHLWMSRVSSAILHTCGHPELIAYSEQEYFDITVNLANDHKKLANYHKHLKNEIENSELNIERFMLRFEKAIWDMWDIKCKENQ